MVYKCIKPSKYNIVHLKFTQCCWSIISQFKNFSFFFLVLKYKKGDFPGNPVVKNLCFQGKFDWVVNLGLIGNRLPMLHGTAKNK